MNDRHFLLRIFNVISLEKNRIRKIKQNKDIQKDHVGYGIRSIVYAILMVAAASIIFLLGAIESSGNPLLAFFLLLMIVLAAIIFPILAAVYSLVFSIVQMSLNSKPIGWISLIIFLICLVPTVLIIFSYIDKN